ncbi:MAG: hypothetical protein PHT02_15225 [Tissierellia bacterium]|nr:hypothetical protein [Tissierellia bacterium]
MKLYQIENVYQSLTKLLTKELSIKTSYKLSKLGKLIIDEYKLFEETRMKIIDKYGDKDEEGNIIQNDNKITIPKENLDSFNKEFNELMDIEVKFDFEPISIDKLGEINISPIDLMVLGDFIVE